MLKFIVLALVCISLAGCSAGPRETPPAELPLTVPREFQGYWQPQSGWDHLHIASDGLVRALFPKDFKPPFDPQQTTPSASSYLKVFHRTADSIYAISTEQRLNLTSKEWEAPTYYYVILSLTPDHSLLTYQQKPCNLNPDDLKKTPAEHWQRLMHSACTIIETQNGLQVWARTTTYTREGME